jgi:serine/threonine-protein kinase RsbW
MPPESRIAISIPSRLDHLDLVQAVAEEGARLAGLDDDAKLDFGLAVREGVVNAIKHAHKYEPREPVEIAFEQVGDTLSATIVDQGPGFDPASVPDPREPENLMRTSGRGLFLIHGLVDEVRFTQRARGMELVLVKRRAAEKLREASSGT